jgi:hypothetical protein
MGVACGLVVFSGRYGATAITRIFAGKIPMHDQHSPEHREVKTATEARQGEVSRGARMRKVLSISVALTVVALLVIYFSFAE